MEFNTSGGFRSRRSYPNLHHISLAPLTPRFPIDDDIEPTDYFSHRAVEDQSGSDTRAPPRTSYLSSVSVPSTPPILSHSRSTSRTRHARSKSSTRAGPLSDTNLHSKSVALPLHHQHATHKKHPSSSHTRRLGEATNANSKSDAEWMLRAGIALASSTREEKGQSWLTKRESSTSLVSDAPFDDASTTLHHRHHHRTKSASSHKSRSGASTPGGPFSRRSSRSRGGSRRGSRAGLTMTTMPPSSAVGKAPSPGTGTVSPEVRGRDTGSLLPDFVDARIRAEMEALQLQRSFTDEQLDDWDGDGGDDSECESCSDEIPEEFDEADLARLTRERGFGLGSWIDRLVEWTLFGVDEWPVAAPASMSATRIGAAATTTTVTFEDGMHAGPEEQAYDTLSMGSVDVEDDVLSHTDRESIVVVEKPGVQGGWEDVGWLLRVMKRTLI
ncbi:hypothetical protein N7462_009308 [Penicillium macrosclerotiorum]|uniref:uncharacterized protein n=1 Tax=Penicillium macrosclerotiorum TaxID=303699 RepID=UPI0025485AB8|nr:uncharacterized protein N7462_009308 [Penicillium macrosclerotiorum]KAJ5673869.1 hypothetical protein N7462_009308 [Penicillium macrosclerotiorum]